MSTLGMNWWKIVSGVSTASDISMVSLCLGIGSWNIHTRFEFENTCVLAYCICNACNFYFDCLLNYGIGLNIASLLGAMIPCFWPYYVIVIGGTGVLMLFDCGNLAQNVFLNCLRAHGIDLPQDKAQRAWNKFWSSIGNNTPSTPGAPSGPWAPSWY